MVGRFRDGGGLGWRRRRTGRVVIVAERRRRRRRVSGGGAEIVVPVVVGEGIGRGALLGGAAGVAETLDGGATSFVQRFRRFRLLSATKPNLTRMSK
jgi:hypothetical protein